MSGVTRIHHTTVLVTDLEKADQFYGGVLELPRIPRPDFPSRGLWYEIDGTQLHLVETEEPDATNVRHVAFVVDDLEATLSKVDEMGLPIWGDIQLDGWARKHCRDPFGNGVELLQPIEGSAATVAASSSHVDRQGRWQIDPEEDGPNSRSR